MAQFKKWRIPLNHLIIYYFPQGGEGCSSAEDPRPLQLKSEWRSAVSGMRKVFEVIFEFRTFIVICAYWLIISALVVLIVSFIDFKARFSDRKRGFAQQVATRLLKSSCLKNWIWEITLCYFQFCSHFGEEGITMLTKCFYKFEGGVLKTLNLRMCKLTEKVLSPPPHNVVRIFTNIFFLNMNMIVATASAWTFSPRWFPTSPPRFSPQTTSAGPPRSRLSVLFFYKESGTIFLY